MQYLVRISKVWYKYHGVSSFRHPVYANEPSPSPAKSFPGTWTQLSEYVLSYQLLVIHAKIANHQGGASWVFPCVYMLLTSKDTDIYLEGFTFLKFLHDFAPQTIMVDFEMALRNSLSQVFPSAVVDGCYFHFCQAVLRLLVLFALTISSTIS